MVVRITKDSLNLRQKLAELERPIGINGQALLATDTPQQAFDLLGAGRRNLIINGDFKVSQRGDYTTSAVTAGHDTYWLDRWMSLKDGTTSTVQRVTRTINGVSKYAARIECTVAGSGIIGFVQRVELANIPVGEILTASCWVRTNHPSVGFRTNAFSGFGGDVGSKFISDGGWRKVSWTFNSTGTVSSTPDILIVAYNNAPVSIAVGNYIEIADVQLEVGKVATPFEYRSYGQELALCQRYYHQLKSGGTYSFISHAMTCNTNIAWTQFKLPVSMRIQPTVSFLNVGAWYTYTGNFTSDATSVTVNGYGITTLDAVGLQFTGMSGVSTQPLLLAFSTSSGYLTFSAEL
jgi:hypothetical protein